MRDRRRSRDLMALGRGLAVMGLVSGGACAPSDDGFERPVRPELRIDVEVEGESVHVSVIEVARPRACNAVGFPEAGRCAPTTDVIVCSNPPPASWIAWVHIVAGGHVIGAGALEPAWGATMEVDGGVPDGARLVIGYDDGFALDVPMPPAPVPPPTLVIDDLVPTGGGGFEIRWHSTPPLPHAIVRAPGDFGGPRCHLVDVTSTVITPPDPIGEIVVSVYPSPTIIPTDAGLVHVWPRTTARVEHGEAIVRGQ